MKLAIVALALVFGIAGAQAQERYHSYHSATHGLVSEMNFGGHREYAGLVEQMLNAVPSSAHGYVSHMIATAPRGPGDDFPQ
jgi:hypothetical protein